MIEYRCSCCSEKGVRLWRQYQTCADQIELLCVDCAELAAKTKSAFFSDGTKPQGTSDSIGWMVPAVPADEGETFWGYTSVPQDRVVWWYALPMRVSAAAEAAEGE